MFILISHFLSRVRACHGPSPRSSGWHWPDFTAFVHPLFPPPPAAALRPSVSPPHNPSDGDRIEAGSVASPPLRSPKLKLLLVSLPFATVIFNLFFCCCLNLRAQQWGESLALPGPRCQARGRVERCGWRGVGWGYVSSLGSGLLTGLPPFMTTGSLVVLLEGGPPASLGTASPTSCNEGSRYIATGGGARSGRSPRQTWEEEESKGSNQKSEEISKFCFS